jgi:hypothetical protein
MFIPVVYPSIKTILRRKRVSKLIRDLDTFGDPDTKAYWIDRVKNDPYRKYPWE